MPYDLRSLDGTAWLAEPARFRPFVARALKSPCPSVREVAEARRAGLDAARALPAQALAAGGADDPAELSLAAPGKSVRAARGKVAVIPVYGPADQRMSSALEKAGGTPWEYVAAALDACL